MQTDGAPDQAGLTLRSFLAAIFCLVVMAMHVQYVEVILADQSAIAEHALPISAMAVFAALTLVGGGLYGLTRWRLLTKQEVFCVLLAMLIATPMMTQGMWHRFIGLLAATPRTESFAYLDALNDKLWPHGDNLLAGQLRENNPPFQALGAAPRWAEVEVQRGRRERALVLENRQPGAVNAVVFPLPVTADSQRGIVPGEPYLVSMEVRGEGFATETRVFCRVYAPAGDRYQELITLEEEQEVSFLHQGGFIRAGAYRVAFAPGTNATVRLAFGLSGPGRLVLRDPKLFSVAALEQVYSGRESVSASQYATLPPAERGGLIVRPEHWCSLAGLRYIVTGYIPVRAWLQTAVAWSSLIGLLLAATLAIAVFMRRQWAEEQRYPFPLFQIPWRLLGEDAPPAEPAALPPIWRNPLLWWGLVGALTWALLRGWHFYNPKVPDLNIEIPLGQYMSDPGWGGMWQVTFGVSAIMVSLCLFMELNVLLSFLLGFLLFRSLLWVGHSMGWDAALGYPFRYQQAIGAYLGYAAIVLLVSHRHLRELGRAIGRGQWAGAVREAFSPRVAALVLAGSFAGAMLWAWWLAVSVSGIVLFFAFLVTVGFVAAKLRAECGFPFGYFTPYNAMLFMGLLGGMTCFGAEAMLVCLIASGFLTVSVFFYIPGLQVELLEFGRRLHVRPRHLVATGVLGVVAGLFLGGWVFLSNAYALGGDSIKYQWAFNQNWFFGEYRAELSHATAQWLGKTAGATEAAGVKPETWAYVFGAGGTLLLTLVRQGLPGFWFHPIGFILGSSHLLEFSWGSMAVAWLVKFVSLKVGGAEFYRRKLVPIAVGVFLGALASILIFNIQTTVLRARGVEVTYSATP